MLKHTRRSPAASTSLATLPDHPIAKVDELMPWAWKPRIEATSIASTAVAASPTATRQPVVRAPGAHAGRWTSLRRQLRRLGYFELPGA